MSKWRQAAKVDANQQDIVKKLKSAGYTVAVGHDDILVGGGKRTLWVEIKTMDTFKKSGGIKAGEFKDSQINLLKTWKGDYMVAWTFEQILTELNRMIKG